MNDSEEFYRQRDRRTHEYLGSAVIANRPIHVEVGGDAISSAAGQLALLALANQLARIHRVISFSLPTEEVDVMVETVVPGSKLRHVLLETVRAIDPFGVFRLGAAPPDALAIALGSNVGGRADWFIGADRALAFLSKTPVGFTPFPATMRGAALASCLGAAVIFRTCIGRDSKPRVVSAWNYLEESEADPGPFELEPLDIGRVLLVGAGAVGASAVFWLQAFGVVAHDWVIVDGDRVAVHNTNRGLLFTAASAGWAGQTPENKAVLVSRFLPGSVSCDDWYDQCELRDKEFDVVLALANDRNVRYLLAHRNAAVSIQATTGENWISQLHRHISGRDDCIWCRTGEIKAPKFGCSTSSVEMPTGEKTDASLPFLSAAAGLMLATALQRLHAGDLSSSQANCLSWDFESGHRMAATPSRFECREGCSIVWPPEVRRETLVKTRWGHLDPALGQPS